MNRETLKDSQGKIVGYIDTDSRGNRVGKDFYGKIVGTYWKNFNLTKDFYGKIVAQGDAVAALVFQSQNNYK